MSPARKREAVAKLVDKLGTSECRACRVLSQPRSSQRRASAPRDDEPAVIKRMRELARERPRFPSSSNNRLLKAVDVPLRSHRRRIDCLQRTHLACVLECVRFEMCVLSRVWLSLAAGSIPAASTF